MWNLAQWCVPGVSTLGKLWKDRWTTYQDPVFRARSMVMVLHVLQSGIDDSGVKSTSCSCTGLRFVSQHLCGSPLSIPPGGGDPCSLLTSVCWGNAGFGTFHHLDERTSQVYWVCQDSETKVTETGARAIFVLLVVCFSCTSLSLGMLWHSSVHLLSRPLLAVR